MSVVESENITFIILTLKVSLSNEEVSKVKSVFNAYINVSQWEELRREKHC